MYRIIASAAALVASLAVLGAAPALAVDPPYLKLAQALGTPELADSSGPKDRSQLLLVFVRHGESAKNWTKLTTVSIAKVAPNETDSATRTIIARFRARLATKHVAVDTFDRSPIAPVTGYFAYHGGGEKHVGIIYSPTPGYVTIAQVAVRGNGAIAKDDVARLRHVIGK